MVLLVDTSKAVQEQQQSTWHGIHPGAVVEVKVETSRGEVLSAGAGQ